MKFLKDNWLNLILGALATKVIEWAIQSLGSLDWDRFATSLVGSPKGISSFLMLILLPMTFYEFFKYHKFNSKGFDVAARLFFAVMLLSYCVGAAVAILTKNIDGLVEDLRQDPASKVIFLLYAIYFLGRFFFNTLYDGGGADKREKPPENPPPPPQEARPRRQPPARKDASKK